MPWPVYAGEWQQIRPCGGPGEHIRRRQLGAPARPRLSAAELLAAKHTRPIQSLDDLAADIFESDEELEEFLAFTYAERHRDLA
jgi:hypothetical protein